MLLPLTEHIQNLPNLNAFYSRVTKVTKTNFPGPLMGCLAVVTKRCNGIMKVKGENPSSLRGRRILVIPIMRGIMLCRPLRSGTSRVLQLILYIRGLGRRCIRRG